MIEDDKNLIPNQESEQEKQLITEKDLTKDEEALVSAIINAPNKEVLEQQFELFNIAQSKKNAIRVSKLNKLMDMIEDQAIDRFSKRPDQISNKEILEYMSVISSHIERAKNDVNTDLSYKPSIQVNQQTTEVNVNVGGSELDRASKERVMDAISALLKQAQASVSSNENQNSQEYNIELSEKDIKEEENFLDSNSNVLYDEEE